MLLNDYKLTKRMRKGREVMVRRYIPDPEVVEQMKTKIEQVVKDTGFNVSYIDAAKYEMWGSYENFIRIRIGGCNHYLSEAGVAIFCKGVRDGMKPTTLREIMRDYNIKSTRERKLLLQNAIYEELIEKRKLDENDPDLLFRIIDKTEIELIRMYNKFYRRWLHSNLDRQDTVV